MKTLLAVIFVSCSACASEIRMSRAANSLESVKSLYRAACEPVEFDKNVCESGKSAINDLVDFYEQVNEGVAE